MVLKRAAENPILTRKDIPAISPHLLDPSSVFNPGAVDWEGGVLLLLRVQSRGRETCLVTARSDDGIRFQVAPEAVRMEGLEDLGHRVYHVYDPRITRIGEMLYVVVAMDMDDGTRLGLAQTRDAVRFEFLGIVSGPDVRNGVLFPEKVEGRFLRLERPNRVRHPQGPSTGDLITLSESDDLLSWSLIGPVMEGRPRYWDEWIGSGPPPIKTRAGWLHLYHGVATHFAGANIYQTGVALLDLEDPTRVLARSRQNILEPRESYELIGQVGNVVFPTGAVVDSLDGEGFAAETSRVRVYYGAADTVVAVAEATVGELLGACRGAGGS